MSVKQDKKETKKRNLNIRVTDMDTEDSAITTMMMDPDYLRQSSSLIQEALQKGFDVLQLANGDIVCTGTKTIVHRYSWDENKTKLTQVKQEKPSAKEQKEQELSFEA